MCHKYGAESSSQRLMVVDKGIRHTKARCLMCPWPSMQKRYHFQPSQKKNFEVKSEAEERGMHHNVFFKLSVSLLSLSRYTCVI